MDISNSIRSAISCLQTGNYSKAGELCAQVLRKDPVNVPANHILGKLADMRESYREAAGHLQIVWQANQHQPEVLLEYGRVLRLAKRTKEAVLFLSESLGRDKNYQVCLELGLALSDAGEYEEASKFLKEALIFKSDCRFSIKRLGEICVLQGKHSAAIPYFNKLVEMAPASVHSYPDLIQAYLASGDPKAALLVTEDCLKLEPACTGALALKHVALIELGYREEARHLFSPEKYLKKISAPCPPSFENIGDFNSYLANHILNNVEMFSGLDKYSTVNGTHSEMGRLFETNPQLGQEVQDMINASVETYVSMLPDDPDHPVSIGRPSEYGFSPWAVVMDFQGHQKAHIHPTSWIAGAYYVQLPGDFDNQPEPCAGHIGFGRGPEELHVLGEPEVLTLKPEEGCFVMFPGYFWHHTIPLLSEEKRICLAFDLVPTKGWGK